MGARRAPPRQSAAARRAQEARFTRKSNRSAVKKTGRQSSSARRTQERKFRIKATQSKFKLAQKAKGSGSKQIKRSVGRTRSLNRRNLRSHLGRSGRGFRTFRGRRR